MYRVVLTLAILCNLILPFAAHASPVFKIDIQSDKVIVDPAERIKFNVRIFGNGNISDNYLIISSDEGVNLKTKDDETRGFLIEKFKDNDVFNKKFIIRNHSLSVSEFGLVKPENIEKLNQGYGPQEVDIEPFYTIYAQSDKRGDHTLSFIFKYADENEQYYIDQKDIKIHINSPYEQYETAIIVLTILLTIFALFFGGAYNCEIKKGINKFVRLIKENLKKLRNTILCRG